MKNPLASPSTKYRFPEAYCLIKYRGAGIEEVLWNGRDGAAPYSIYSRDGKHNLIRVKGPEERVRHYTPKLGERYLAAMTRERALYITAKVIEGRWDHPKYPLRKTYETKQEARFLLFKSFFDDGKAFTILKQGKDPTRYLTKQFRNFVDSDNPS